MMEVLHSLFQAHGNQQPQDDGGDVNEEVPPSGGGVMGRVTSSMADSVERSGGEVSTGVEMTGDSPCVPSTDVMAGTDWGVAAVTCEVGGGSGMIVFGCYGFGFSEDWAAFSSALSSASIAFRSSTDSCTTRNTSSRDSP